MDNNNILDSIVILIVFKNNLFFNYVQSMIQQQSKTYTTYKLLQNEKNMLFFNIYYNNSFALSLSGT